MRPNLSFAQGEITGKVQCNLTPISSVAIEFKQDDKVIKVFSDSIGQFKIFSFFENKLPLYVSLYKKGFQLVKDSLIKVAYQYDLNIQKVDTITILKEVFVNKQKSFLKSNKTIYKINHRDYLSNTKSDVILKTLPNVSIGVNDVLIDNRKKAVIYIDGIVSSIEELKKIDAKEIDKIEVIPNPSAFYGTGETRGVSVINIIKRKLINDFYKSEMAIYKGIRLNSNSIQPSIAFKNKKIVFSSFASYNTNNQNIVSDYERYFDGNIEKQNVLKEVKGNQKYMSTRLKIDISPKADIIINGAFFGYVFNEKTMGDLYKKGTASELLYNGKEKMNKLTLNAVYNYSMNDSTSFLLKAKYFNYFNENYTLFQENINNVISKIKEGAIEISFIKNKLLLFGCMTELTANVRQIVRKFDILPNKFQIFQYVSALYSGIDISLNKNLSLYTMLSAENTANVFNDKQKYYFNFLPTVSVLYQFSNKLYSIRADYAKNIIRPSTNYLNPNVIFLNPLYKLAGNSNLLPQINQIFELSLTKYQNEKTLSIKLFNENHKNLVSETFKFEKGDIINSYANIGIANVSGFNLGYTFKLIKKININANNGFSYHIYKTNANNVLFHENSGISYNSSVNIYAVIKNKIACNLNGSYTSRLYDLTKMSIYYPIFTFDISRNFLKDRLCVNINYFDMFGLYSKNFNKVKSSSFSQTIHITNKITNVNMSII